MNDTVVILANLYYGSSNLKLAFRPLILKSRFSIWNADRLYTPAEIIEITGNDSISVGQTAEVKIMIWSGLLHESLKPGDILSWGVPYNVVGTVEYVKTLDD